MYKLTSEVCDLHVIRSSKQTQVRWSQSDRVCPPHAVKPQALSQPTAAVRGSLGEDVVLRRVFFMEGKHYVWLSK